ncbi:MAG: glycosyltransferase [Chloroflexi bacterium]|nr:glycosyltransferase [Chloroflexota bacterium]
MRPKILHLASTKLSSGGVERFLLGLCQSLRADFKFALLSGAEESFNKQIYDLGCAAFPWDVNGAFDRRATIRLTAALQIYQPDIVHIHDARAGLIARAGFKRIKAKVAYTVHLPPYYYRWEKFSSQRQFIYASVERLLNTHRTDAVIYPSRRGWQDALRHRYAPEPKALCIPNGIDLSPFANAPRKETNPIPVICTLARLSAEKNVGLLLEAASILTKRGRALSLWILGDGPQRAHLERRAAELGLSSLTRFWGRVDDVSAPLFQSDIFALTSWYEGGRSQAAMEAQAAGLPSVLSDVGDNDSLAENGCGFLFPEGDAEACAAKLEALLLNPQLRQQMGQAARAKAFESYSLSTMAGAYRNMYRALTDSKVSDFG